LRQICCFHRRSYRSCLPRIDGRGVGSRSLYRKTRNNLWFALVRELKIFFLQIRDHFAVAVAHDDAHKDYVDAHLKRRGRIVGHDLVIGSFCLRLWGVLESGRLWVLGNLRSCGLRFGAGNRQTDGGENAANQSEPDGSRETA
jgi:hypothetical protein